MRKYPLATVISQSNEGLFVSHLPLVVEKHGDDVVLIGHLARANHHWKLMNEQSVYVIFNGPNAYITPKWYAENGVPTWNYAVVHAKGTSSLIQDGAGIKSCLEKLSQFAEREISDPWSFWIPDDLSQPGVLEKAIVGFSIKIESLQPKFKLSQNRSDIDRDGVMRGLESRKDDMSYEVLMLMRNGPSGCVASASLPFNRGNAK